MTATVSGGVLLVRRSWGRGTLGWVDMEQGVGAGHVFVAHTKLENLQYDAVVIPTDHWLKVEPYWGPALGVDADRLGGGSLCDALTPGGWVRGETTWARVPDEGRAPALGQDAPAPAWFLAVGRSRETDDVEWLIGNLLAVLREIACSGAVKPGPGRARPLIAATTLGVGKGGFEQERGEVIRRILAAVQEFAKRSRVDVVFAVTDAADYAAFQQQRRQLDSFPNLSEELKTTGTSLAEMAKAGELALFIGAGASMSAGLPSWGDLLTRLCSAASLEEKELDEFDSALDKAEYLVQRLGGQKELQKKIGKVFGEVVQPGLSHVQLAALGCREVVTTNYDSLYEAAFDATRPDHKRVKVLPFEQRKPFDHWVLKMHGDLNGGDIVLTRSDFVGYENAFGPVGAIVQSLLLTRHLLVVGASMTDDNLLRLAYEVAAYLGRGEQAGEDWDPFGTILALDGSTVKKDFWSGKFNYVGVSASQERAEQARDLSIMLDFIAMHAAESSHLLDERYGTLLKEPEIAAAEKARELSEVLDSLPTQDDPGWTRLRGVLAELGAGGSRGAEMHESASDVVVARWRR